MNTYNKYLDIHSIKSSNGKIVKCKYRQHPSFDINSQFFFHLHFIFVHFASERARSHGYGLSQSYCCLFDYLSLRSESGRATEVSSLTDINSEIFNGYQRYLKKTKKNIELATRLKTALKCVGESTGKVPAIYLPTVDLPAPNKTEPLEPQAFEELSAALRTHVDALYKKIEFRKKVDMAEPYKLETIKNEFFTLYTRQNIFRWRQHKISIGSKSANLTRPIQSILSKSCDPELLALASNPNALTLFRNLYDKEGSDSLLENPINPFEQDGVRNWVPDDMRTIKTLLCNGYPMDIPLSQQASEYIPDKLHNFERCDSIIQILMHRYGYCNHPTIQYRTPLWDEVLGKYFPTMVDMSALVIFIMLQSGWNKETVLAIDSEDFEDIFNGMINDSLTVVFSEKQRGQSTHKPFFNPKRYSALSSKDNIYSIHNLILLAQELSSPLKDYKFDFVGMDASESSLNPLFLCIRYYADWANKGGRHTSSSNSKAFLTGTKHFLKQYPIFENGARLNSAIDITRRLRPTWMKFHKKKNPLSVLALQQGHNDSNTTDVYYD